MKFTAIQILLIISLTWSSRVLFAQDSGIQVTGRVVESSRQQPVEYATVAVKATQTGELLDGAITAADGTFSVSSPTPDVYLEVSFIGFVSKTVKNLRVTDGKIAAETIVLTEDRQTLEEVVVQGEKSQTEFKLDKRVFNVGKDLSTTGASALQVLNNVPSVSVNIEGAISLRGSQGVSILINGKPSVLASEQGNALGTITADMIERIEVITSPSAKYDAEGTSGIINIVLKKEENRGVNGSVTVNTGVPNNHSVGLSVNKRTEKFNLFSQLGAGHRTFPEYYRTVNRSLADSTSVYSAGEADKNETFFNVILGADYHLNASNVLSLTGQFAYELEREFSGTDFRFMDQTHTLTSQWKRDEDTRATNPKWQYELQYKKIFRENKEHTLLFSALGNFFGKDQSSEFDNTTTFGTETYGAQQTRTDFREGEYTFKLDYTHPFADKFTLETGAQHVISDVTNDYAVSNRVDNAWVNDPGLTNIFEYHQQVAGVYGTGAYEGKQFGVKLGLRVEHTDMHTRLLTTGQKNRQQYTSLFPSAHASYKITRHVSLQAGYSRRVFRPGLWDLNPFFNIRNNFSISTGNPALQPEFTDSYEITGIYDKGPFSVNLGTYHRYTTDVIEEVSTFADNVSTSRPVNIGTNRATGVELNTKYTPARWLTVNGDFNYNYFSREGTFETRSFDFTADQWSARMMAKLKLPGSLDVEVTGNYQSAVRTFQRETAGYLFTDLGVRKKLMKGRTILNLSVRDVFASRIFETETSQPDFYLYSYRRQGRFITFGISYGFGKGDAMEFSGQKRF